MHLRPPTSAAVQEPPPPAPATATAARARGDERLVPTEMLYAKHILIKHEGSRGKASWRDPQGVAISAITRDDAADLARALREQIVAGELKFENVAAENSDCNSAKRGGVLVQCLLLSSLLVSMCYVLDLLLDEQLIGGLDGDCCFEC